MNELQEIQDKGINNNRKVRDKQTETAEQILNNLMQEKIK